MMALLWFFYFAVNFPNHIFLKIDRLNEFYTFLWLASWDHHFNMIGLKNDAITTHADASKAQNSAITALK